MDRRSTRAQKGLRPGNGRYRNAGHGLFECLQTPMRAEDVESLRYNMLAVIAAFASALRNTIGKSALDERVVMAMGKVPRHEFVPIDLQPSADANIHVPTAL